MEGQTGKTSVRCDNAIDRLGEFLKNSVVTLRQHVSWVTDDSLLVFLP